MSTCIEHRGNCSWRVTISAGYSDGRQQRVRRTYRLPEDWSLAKQRKEIEKKAALLLAECCNKQVVPGQEMLFSDYAELWLREYAKINLEAKNYYCAESRLKLRILPSLGKKRLSEIRTLTITEFINKLSRSTDPRTGRTLAPRTVINYIAQLSSMFTIASNWDLVSSNPCAKVIKPKIESYDITIPSETDSIDMLERLTREPMHYQCLVHLGIMTGLRLGEIVGLKWSDINFESNEIQVSRAMSYVPKLGNIDKVPKTRKSRRSLILPASTIELLKQLKDRQQLNSRVEDPENGYLFTGSDGSPLGHNTPSRWFRHFIIRVREEQRQNQLLARVPTKQIKVMPIIRFHDLRHFHASLLLAKGIDLETVSRRLGHARTSTTVNIYCHPMKGRDELAAKMIESTLIGS